MESVGSRSFGPSINEQVDGLARDPSAQTTGESSGIGGASFESHSSPVLSGRNIALGDGAERSETLQQAEKSKGFFKTLAQPFVALAHGIKAFFTAGSEARKVELRYQQHVQAELSRPMPGSVLEEPAVLDKLVDHAQKMGTPLSRDEIRGLVAAGEHIALAIQNSPDGGSPLHITSEGGQTLRVDSGLYATRALSWYMMSMGAMQDVKRDEMGLDTPSAMPTNGAFIMKDPGNRIHNFLMQAPTCGSRVSSHVNERSASPHGLLGQPIQHGIEDFGNKMPGQGGTLLFDKLKGEELYVKIESVGCPPVFSGRERHEGVGAMLSRILPSIWRNIQHGLNFASTRSATGNTSEGVRQEHVYKGRLKDAVYTPVKDLVDHAKSQGLDFGKDKLLLDSGKSMKKLGMSAVFDMFDKLEAKAREQGRDDILHKVQDVRNQVQIAMSELDFYSGKYGIERRGAEVHISLDPRSR